MNGNTANPAKGTVAEAWCGHCSGKGYLNAWMRAIYGNCGNCKGTGRISLSEDEAAWMREHDPDRIIPTPEGDQS